MGLLAVIATWGTGLMWVAAVLVAAGALVVLGRGKQVSAFNGYTMVSMLVVVGSIGTIVAGVVGR